jgi:hypothetical protein
MLSTALYCIPAGYSRYKVDEGEPYLARAQ